MIQKCPRCRSARIKLGYRPNPWWSVIFGRYNLLCDECNWEFVGFAVPGTPAKTSRKRIKQAANNRNLTVAPPDELKVAVVENTKLSETINSNGETVVEAATTASVPEIAAVNGKNASIDNVLTSDERRLANPKKNLVRTKRKRRGSIKMKR